MSLSQQQLMVLGSIKGGIQTRENMDDVQTQKMAYENLPVEWRDDKPSEEKARKLLHFFKYEYFTWVNQPACEACQKGTKLIGVREPTSMMELFGLASRVEMYTCDSNHQTTFPRYNHPQALMRSRKGRCGEFANCFCVLAIACGFKTRYVLDLTDHVWAELFIEEKNRWIHCDPCECAFDAALVYEGGWNKKLSWVFAFERGGYVKDVTRRYSQKWDVEMLKRRIDGHSLKLTKLLQDLAPPYIVDSEKHEFEECIKLTLKTKQEQEKRELKPEEARGRITGSLSWKLSRGELGDKKKEFKVRYQAFIDQGLSPNEAAARALKEMHFEEEEE